MALAPPGIGLMVEARANPVVARRPAELADKVLELRRSGRLALVPTMGSLHEGHLSLVDRAREEADRVAVTLFVNPLQFAPGEDFERYPRAEERDLALLEERGVDLVYAPSPSEVYPDGSPVVTVHPGPLGERLCGAYRPGHFSGVLTVVAKLLSLFRPDVAVFGRKDYQQWVLVQRMVRDLDMGVHIAVAPTVRDGDGLALSSRNAYLSPAGREQARGLHQALEAGRAHFASGERSAASLLRTIRATLSDFAIDPQYVELVHPETLEGVERAEGDCVAALAAYVGTTRLIDNVVIS